MKLWRSISYKFGGARWYCVRGHRIKRMRGSWRAKHCWCGHFASVLINATARHQNPAILRFGKFKWIHLDHVA